jgi:hypothetical protein
MAEPTQRTRTEDSPPTEDSRQQALAALALPSPGTLTEEQLRGATCVWDGTTLTPETAIDLVPRRDGPYQWFPRACVACITTHALAALYDHVDECSECSTANALCPAGRQLYRLSIHGGR